jgi:hypothetical protein
MTGNKKSLARGWKVYKVSTSHNAGPKYKRYQTYGTKTTVKRVPGSFHRLRRVCYYL